MAAMFISQTGCPAETGGRDAGLINQAPACFPGLAGRRPEQESRTKGPLAAAGKFTAGLKKGAMVRKAHPEWKILVWMAYAGWCVYVLLTVLTENIMPVMPFSR